MQAGTARKHTLSLRTLLAWDAALEVAIGAALIAFVAVVAPWLAIGTGVAVGVGVAFLGAAAVIAFLARNVAERRSAVQALAIGNIAAGSAGWLLLVLAWGAFDPPGRSLLGAASDAFILLGVLELMALRRERSRALT
jgi:hypothetical protein